uniref:(northern house mosquito) hypothetical protein n=1 Tax=Culex pipiens TaxID=7175 RepID=A0A8D8LEW8_CULPI
MVPKRYGLRFYAPVILPGRTFSVSRIRLRKFASMAPPRSTKRTSARRRSSPSGTPTTICTWARTTASRYRSGTSARSRNGRVPASSAACASPPTRSSRSRIPDTKGSTCAKLPTTTRIRSRAKSSCRLCRAMAPPVALRWPSLAPPGTSAGRTTTTTTRS